MNDVVGLRAGVIAQTTAYSVGIHLTKKLLDPAIFNWCTVLGYDEEKTKHLVYQGEWFDSYQR